MSHYGRLIMIGLDGVPFELLRDLAERGIMPVFRRLIRSGFFHPAESTIPEISSVAWSSIITGKNAAQHGIFGFMDIPRGTYRVSFPNFNSLKADAFWMSDPERSIIINVPATFPVRALNGIHISGFVSLDMARSVYPGDLIPLLEENDYRIDVESEKAHQSLELFLRDLDKTLDARGRVARELWKKEGWKNFMLVFTGTDRLMHFLWNAYEDKSHRHHTGFLDHFRKIDSIVGELLDDIREEDILICLSDHGMERLDLNVYINYILRDKGFLALPPATGLFSDVDCHTKAFSLDPARIYVNKRDKYPRGSVCASDVRRICDDLIDLFREIEVDGKKLCKSIYRKEEVFTGPLLDDAPDLVLVGNEGLNLHSSLKASSIADKPIFTGKHTQHNAFMLAKDIDKDFVFKSELTVTNILHIAEEIKHSRGVTHE